VSSSRPRWFTYPPKRATAWAYGGAGKFGAIDGDLSLNPVARSIHFACLAVHRLRDRTARGKPLRLYIVEAELGEIAVCCARLSGESQDAATARVVAWYTSFPAEEAVRDVGPA
jgi:hypothetical protein